MPLVSKEIHVVPVPLGMHSLVAGMQTGIWILSVDLQGIPVC